MMTSFRKSSGGLYEHPASSTCTGFACFRSTVGRKIFIACRAIPVALGKCFSHKLRPFCSSARSSVLSVFFPPSSSFSFFFMTATFPSTARCFVGFGYDFSTFSLLNIESTRNVFIRARCFFVKNKAPPPVEALADVLCVIVAVSTTNSSSSLFFLSIDAAAFDGEEDIIISSSIAAHFCFIFFIFFFFFAAAIILSSSYYYYYYLKHGQQHAQNCERRFREKRKERKKERKKER